MRRNIRSRRAGATRIVPEQAKECRFYEVEENCCNITKNGEMICEHKRCSLCVLKEAAIKS